MTEIVVYRGALRDSDGFPVLEQVQWSEVPQDHPDAVQLPAELGLAAESRWKFMSASDLLVDLPVTPQTRDRFGRVVEWGGIPAGPIDVYALPVRDGFTLVTEDAWAAGYEAYRQAVDPVGMPPLPEGGQPVLYLPTEPAEGVARG
ncbi:hypothetical protein ABT300_08850 [Streptomyces sp. NPDC001027]|uniref:hypothetical protein n=1 Tax=Streptomyces sp. NPDC001027 TaxID=3154771 RepID=UPI00331B2325